MTEFEFQWSDIWLFQSIIIGGDENGATLYDIISTGDAINHAIFNDDELESGFARLTAGDLIFDKDHKFFPTEKGRDIYEKVSSKGGSIYNTQDRLKKLLKASPYDPKQKYPNPKNNLRYPGFSSQTVQETIELWHKEARRMMKKE